MGCDALLWSCQVAQRKFLKARKRWFFDLTSGHQIIKRQQASAQHVDVCCIQAACLPCRSSLDQSWTTCEAQTISQKMLITVEWVNGAGTHKCIAYVGHTVLPQNAHSLSLSAISPDKLHVFAFWLVMRQHEVLSSKKLDFIESTDAPCSHASVQAQVRLFNFAFSPWPVTAPWPYKLPGPRQTTYRA